MIFSKVEHNKQIAHISQSTMSVTHYAQISHFIEVVKSQNTQHFTTLKNLTSLYQQTS